VGDWFTKRTPAGVAEGERRDLPEGLWVKCDGCGEIVYREEVDRNLGVCPHCAHHFRLGARRRLETVCDGGSFEERDADLAPADPLGFRDSKRYVDRLEAGRAAAGMADALLAGVGRIEGREVSFGAFDFEFMGGSMGAVVGEKVARIFERAVERRAPAVIFSCSGGARMQEGIFSLMQMAKTSVALRRLREARLPYVSVLCNPTTGGVAASFAMQGDVHVAEPGALVGFAGPRVIEQTIREKLPEGFQRSEFLLAHGMVDLIVDRREMRATLSRILRLLAG
jgi:acetyl-CoA carboxylase carboxyl transferase subunit beta